MRISDWSSDVCSSDLPRRHVFRSVCAIGMAGAKGDVVSPIDIVRIPVLSDNYVWLVHDRASKATMVVDPAVAEPVLEAAAARGWTITDIWNRSEEHTSELQSLMRISYAVFCLKKKKSIQLVTIKLHMRQQKQQNILRERRMFHVI